MRWWRRPAARAARVRVLRVLIGPLGTGKCGEEQGQGPRRGHEGRCTRAACDGRGLAVAPNETMAPTRPQPPRRVTALTPQPLCWCAQLFPALLHPHTPLNTYLRRGGRRVEEGRSASPSHLSPWSSATASSSFSSSWVRLQCRLGPRSRPESQQAREPASESSCCEGMGGCRGWAQSTRTPLGRATSGWDEQGWPGTRATPRLRGLARCQGRVQTLRWRGQPHLLPFFFFGVAVTAGGGGGGFAAVTPPLVDFLEACSCFSASCA